MLASAAIELCGSTYTEEGLFRARKHGKSGCYLPYEGAKGFTSERLESLKANTWSWKKHEQVSGRPHLPIHYLLRQDTFLSRDTLLWSIKLAWHTDQARALSSPAWFRGFHVPCSQDGANGLSDTSKNRSTHFFLLAACIHPSAQAKSCSFCWSFDRLELKASIERGLGQGQV